MAKRIPPEKVEEIYNAVDILEVVQDFVQMKKRGSNYFGLSPWQNEKTPSFSVSPSKNIFKDFSTGRGGNAITFLMELEGMTYVEALKYVAEKYGIVIEYDETPEDLEQKDRRESLFIVNSFAARWHQEQLLESETGRKVALTYFKERGILEATIKEFQLGYAPDNWDDFAKAAVAQQFNEEYIEDTGLCFRSDKTGNLIDRFRGRIMFPILSHLGKVLGFGGRILGKKSKIAKYINSPESEIYHKSQVLYGLYHSKNVIRDLDLAILVEGYMDVISLYQAGVKNVVATSGTALTDEQIKLIKRFSKNVLLIYDADPAGIKAALRGADLLLKQELNVKVLLLPEGEDPDSFVKSKGKSGFDTYREEHAKDFVEFKIDQLQKDLDPRDPSSKTRLIHETTATLAMIPDAVRQAVYVQFTAQKLGVEEEIIKNSLRQALLGKQKQDQRQARLEGKKNEQKQQEVRQNLAEAQVSGKTLSQERELLRIMFNHGDKDITIEEEEWNVAEYIIAETGEHGFDDPLLDGLKADAIAHFEKKGKIELNAFLSHQSPERVTFITNLLEIPPEVSRNWEKFDIKAPNMDDNLNLTVTSAVMHFKLKKIKALISQNREKMRSNADSEEADKLVMIDMRLKSLLKEISSELGIVVPK